MQPLFHPKVVTLANPSISMGQCAAHLPLLKLDIRCFPELGTLEQLPPE